MQRNPASSPAEPQQRREKRSTGRARAKNLVLRRQTPELAVVFVRDQIDRAVGSLFDIADSSRQRNALLVRDFVTFDNQPDQAFTTQCADQSAAFPFWKAVAGIEDHAVRRDARRPLLDRVFELRLSRRVGNFLAVVMIAPANFGPAVVLAGLWAVELVTVLRTHFADP